MFSYIGGTFFSFIDHFVNAMSASLSVYAAGLALSATTLYFTFAGFAVMRGEVHEPIKTMVWRATKMAMIFFIAFGSGVYQSEVIGTVYSVSAGLMGAIASVNGGSCGSFGGGEFGGGSAGLLSVLDCNAARGLLVFDSILSGLKELEWYDITQILMLFMASGIYFLCFLILLVAVGLVFFTNALTLSLTLAIGPLFIGALAFEPGKSFFDGWKNKIIYCLTLQVFIMVLIGLAFAVINAYIIKSGFISLDGASVVSNIGKELEAIKKVFSLCVIVILFAFMFTKLDNIANSLVGGGDSSSGLGLAMATTVLIKMAYKATNNQSKDKEIKPGGNIENIKTPAGRNNTEINHKSHEIAERMRNQ